jgi:hypothetical protein
LLRDCQMTVISEIFISIPGILYDGHIYDNPIPSARELYGTRIGSCDMGGSIEFLTEKAHL